MPRTGQIPDYDPMFDPNHPEYNRAEDVRRKLKLAPQMGNEDDAHYQGRQRARGDEQGVTVFHSDDRRPRTGLDNTAMGVLDPRDSQFLQEQVNSLAPKQPMYAKFNGKEYIQYNKPRLHSDVALKLIDERKAARKEAADKLERQQREDKVLAERRFEQESPERIARLNAELERKKSAEEYERGAPEREQKQKQQAEKEYRDKVLQQREDAEFRRSQALRGSVEQEKARERAEKILPVLLKSNDPRKRAAAKRLTEQMDFDPEMAAALTDVTPEETEEHTYKLLESRPIKAEVRNLISQLSEMSFYNTTIGGADEILKPALAKIAAKISAGGGDTAAAMAELAHQIKEKIPGSYWGSIPNHIRDEVDKYTSGFSQGR